MVSGKDACGLLSNLGSARGAPSGVPLGDRGSVRQTAATAGGGVATELARNCQGIAAQRRAISRTHNSRPFNKRSPPARRRNARYLPDGGASCLGDMPPTASPEGLQPIGAIYICETEVCAP